MQHPLGFQTSFHCLGFFFFFLVCLQSRKHHVSELRLEAGGSGGWGPLRKQDQAPFVPQPMPAVLPGLLGTDRNALLFASHDA